MNVWNKLTKPIMVLAPMDDVTDVVFRQVIAETAAPALFFTEFANADGLQSPGREAVLQKLAVDKHKVPVIAQIWGKDPESYYRSAREIAGMGFAGIDINMGCPVRAVIKNGCCSALINNRALASELIAATKEGAGELPVSVKTRLGFSEIETESWSSFLLEQNLAALTIHGRIAAEQSKYPADWGEIAKVVKIANSVAPDTVIIGNGDVLSLEQTELRVRDTGVDGVMIGRGIFQNPWLFTGESGEDRKQERIQLLLRHLELWEQTWAGVKNFEVMKKFFKMYISGWSGAASLRGELMDMRDIGSVRKHLLDVQQKV